MEKLIYVLEGRPELSMRSFADALFDDIVPRMQAAGARELTIHVADLDAEMDTPETKTPRIVGDWSKISGAVHFWIESVDDRARYEQMFLDAASHIDGYLVTESIVAGYERSWSGRESRPGVTQFALGQKPVGVSEEHFYHHWQDIHGPFSFKLHPNRWSYVRNAVARCLTPGSPPWRFVVLEHFQELSHFTDENQYYSSPEIVDQCWIDVPEFLDMGSYVTGPMNEYYIP